eukprot:scaffold2858_cov659-Pavlova_lutheri.AAC.105
MDPPLHRPGGRDQAIVPRASQDPTKNLDGEAPMSPFANEKSRENRRGCEREPTRIPAPGGSAPPPSSAVHPLRVPASPFLPPPSPPHPLSADEEVLPSPPGSLPWVLLLVFFFGGNPSHSNPKLRG